MIFLRSTVLLDFPIAFDPQILHTLITSKLVSRLPATLVPEISLHFQDLGSYMQSQETDY